MNNLSRSARFHGIFDTELGPIWRRFVTRRRTRHFVIQERDVSYRFYPHFHPYVQQLAQRLLREGVSGLQAADTDYVGNASLPGSIEVDVNQGANVSIPDGVTVALLARLQVTLPGGGQLELPANTQLELAGDAAARLPDRLQAALVEGMTATPAPGTVFRPDSDSRAVLLNDAKVILTTADIRLGDGRRVAAPAGTRILLVRGSRLTILANTPVTLLRSKPRPVLFADFLERVYEPDPALLQRPYPVKDLDFTSAGAYSVYNWELFFHVPLTIAIHLSKNQRFAEAQHWFHYLFDPTDDSDGPTPERFWKVRPFQATDVRKIEEILANLATGADRALLEETVNNIEAWEAAPFRPHVIARCRQQAYMFKTVMAYLDNLIAWGDSLFRQDTGEAVDEATMLYVLAANILGPRPQPVPQKGTTRPQTYANLRRDLNQFGSVLRDVEADLPFDLMPFPAEDAAEDDRLARVRSLGKALYFCVPRNDKLLAYWDTVADRLFKIHNSLNLQGVFRQLALFEPPIDPALLARAAAAGLDVSAIVNGLNQPLPLVRFQVLVQRATEIVQEVKSLGNSLLSAMEKEDGEALAILRARHERAVMEMVEQVKYGQLQDAIKAREGLLASLALAVQRYTYYERQLGRQPDEIVKAIPQLADLDRDALDRMKFAMEEPQVGLRAIDVDIAQDLGVSGGEIVSSREVEEMDKLEDAQKNRDTASQIHKAGALLAYFPEIELNMEPMGAGSSVSFGGSHLSNAERLLASFWEVDADKLTYEANRAGKIGSYARRTQDWTLQSNLAAGEINQIFKQLRAAQIREAVAEQDLKSHRLQMKHAEEIERFLNAEGTEKTGKATNKALYTFMKREVKGLYAHCFQLAFDIARKAERALQHELGDPSLTYLQFGYLAGKEGLLAGEKLYLDVKRMEMAYLDLNRREYELTKHVSLLQVNPLALVELRATGRCTFRFPEELFDMDGPGHYFRRIKNVAVTVPCVAGPFVSINLTLTLQKSSIRTASPVGDGYARVDAEDGRFSDYFGSVQSIVTSSGQNDSGLFETNLRDERYLPFENSGAISEWQLMLPANPSKGEPEQFNYDTISDVVLHIRYTAREGGELLRKGAIGNLKECIDDAATAGSVRLFSLRHEFPSEWASFRAATPDSEGFRPLKITLMPQHFPFWSQGPSGKKRQVRDAELIVRARDDVSVSGPDGSDELAAWLGDLKRTRIVNAPKPRFEGKWEVNLTADGIEDAWLLVKWGQE